MVAFAASPNDDAHTPVDGTAGCAPAIQQPPDQEEVEVSGQFLRGKKEDKVNKAVRGRLRLSRGGS